LVVNKYKNKMNQHSNETRFQLILLPLLGSKWSTG
jgi:hypothetical protein